MTRDPDPFRSARAPRRPGPGGATEDERQAAEETVSAAAGQRGPQSLCLEQGAAERNLGRQGAVGTSGGARSRSQLGLGDERTGPDPAPCTPAPVRAWPSVRGGGAGGPRMAGRTAQAQLSGSGLITEWSKGEIAWVTREAARLEELSPQAGRCLNSKTELSSSPSPSFSASRILSK